MHDILKHYKKAGWESIHYRNMCNAMEVHLEMKIKLIDFMTRNRWCYVSRTLGVSVVWRA